MPLKMDINIIYGFINSHKKWIEKSINKLKNTRETNIKDSLTDGGTVKILDSRYMVYIYESSENKIILDGFNIYIYSKKTKDSKYLQKQYNDFLKTEASIYFKKVIDKYLPIFEKYNIPVPTLKVKPLKSKWGSCMPTTAKITLNLYLYKTCAKCIDYVVLHELTHLIYSGHKKRFYNFIQKYMPDYRETEKLLDFEAGQIPY